MIDLLALAFQTDTTRVITVLLGIEQSPRNYPEIGITEGAPRPDASSGRQGKDRKGHADQRVPHQAVRLSARQAEGDRRTATARCSTTR